MWLSESVPLTLEVLPSVALGTFCLEEEQDLQERGGPVWALHFVSIFDGEEFKCFFCHHFAIQFKPHMPVPEFVVNRFPDGVSEVEVPVIFFNVNNAIKRGASFALIVEDPGVINAVIQFLVLASRDVDNEAKFDVDNRVDFGGHLRDFRQRSRV